VKIVLHAAKYPSDAIGGFLIGTAGHISDVIPVYHGVPLAPLLEFAAETVSAMQMKIIGVYFANEIASKIDTPQYIERICETVASKNSGVCILSHLDGTLLAEKSKLCINVSRFILLLKIFYGFEF
jgi:hypothetical protein